MAGIPAKTDPLAAVRSLAEAAARQRGHTFADSGLRLFDAPAAADFDAVDDGLISPFALGRAYELLLAPTSRRKTGSHLTPEAVARNLVAMLPPPKRTDVVLDPAAGGAAFLLVAADALFAVGAKPVDVIDQLVGLDIDHGAVAVAEAAISLWGLDHGIAPRSLPSISHGDGLLDELPQVQRVVGNPPFLNQLRSSSSHTSDRRALLRERWGDLVSTYTDDAWLFLAAGLAALTPQGVLAMVQPISLLAARDGFAVREHVHEQATLDGLWVGRDQVFDAAVQVCGVVVSSGSRRSSPVARTVGSDFELVPELTAQPEPSAWGSAAATALGVPAVHLAPKGTVADLASATAGFRDQFYGFVPYVFDAVASPDNDQNTAPLITVGMIDVLTLRWGTRPFRFAKQEFTKPVIDLDALALGDPRLAEWVNARSRPKLLMATQTRVAEVWVDQAGSAIPATPVLSIEPHGSEDDDLWKLAAALSSPAVSAYLHATNFGTALSLNAMKIAARDVLAVPLPPNTTAWNRAAELLRTAPTKLDEFAALMQDAYEVSDRNLASWWKGRL